MRVVERATERRGNWTDADERIAEVVERNIAKRRDWNEGLLLVAGVPVAVRDDVAAEAAALIYPRVEKFLRWKVRKEYGGDLQTEFGDGGKELMDYAVAYALDDLLDHWLHKDRHLLMFLRARWEAVGRAKGAAWLRAQQELNRERDRQRSGTGVLGDMRPSGGAWRQFEHQRSWSARMSRPADVCYFEMEEERRSRHDEALRNEVYDMLRRDSAPKRIGVRV